MIYYVEDDKNIRELVVYALKQSGFEAMGLEYADLFWSECARRAPDMILLDIMLPDTDGLLILKALRESPQYRAIPIIMLTAKGQEYDKVTGLDAGADDYIAKPFGIMELVSRVKAVKRRYADALEQTILTAGSLFIDLKRHTVLADGEEIALTFKEFALLRHMMEHPNVAFERAQLLDAVWGYDYYGGARTVDVHIQTLRQKLGDCGQMIETVRGIGYRVRG